MWGDFADEKIDLPFTMAACPPQCSHSQVWVPRDSWPYFTVSDSRLPQPGGPGPRIYIPQEQGGPVIPQALGYLLYCQTFLYNYFARTTQETQPLYCWEGMFTAPLHSNGSYLIVACVFVAAGMCLPSRCLARNVYSDLAIPALWRHFTIYNGHVKCPVDIIRYEMKCINI
jgi:hypothetical protein